MKKNQATGIKDFELTAYLRDPVLAAWAIMGAELDEEQSELLRQQWSVPHVIDLTGSKSEERLFISQNLRAILFPDRHVATFYQDTKRAWTMFWDKYESYFDRSSLFADQFIQTGDSSPLEKTLKNRSRIRCASGDFVRDSQNMNSHRFNDLAIYEAPEIDLISGAIDRHLLSRCTRHTENKSPLYANHVIMCGHVEDPMTHPFMKRVRHFRAMIDDGSTTCAIFAPREPEQ